MSTTFLDSVFGVLERPSDAHPDAPISDIADHRHADSAEERPSAGNGSSSGPILNCLRSPARSRNCRAGSKRPTPGWPVLPTVETTEVEIGRLFVEAQRFSEASLSKLEVAILEILREVEAKAKQILTEATEEAHEIRRQAQQAAFASTRTAQELQSAIAGFTTVNNELLKELGALNTMMTPASERGMTEIDPSLGVPESA